MLNKIVLVGRLTNSPKVSTGKDNKEFVSFSLAVQKGKDDVFYIDCLVNVHLNDVVKNHLDKGDKIGVLGSLDVQSYTRKDGTNGKSPIIYVSDIEFIDVPLGSNTEEEEVINFEEPIPETKTAPSSNTRQRRR